MKWLIIPFLFMQVAMAETSKLIPTFVEAAKIYVTEKATESKRGLKSETLAVLEVLIQKNLDPKLMEEVVSKASKKSWILPQDDEYDRFIEESKKSSAETEIPELSLQTTRIDVHKKADIFFNNDVYAYFIITDGEIPLGKATSIYKGLSSGESFFFNEADRSLYPQPGFFFKKPERHFLIDYGVVESGGDDIKKMQQLSSIIVDVALAVYQTKDSSVQLNLRKEIKALADLLLNLHNEDRLFTGTLAYKTSDLAQLLKKDSSIEISKRHQKKAGLHTYDYELHLRLTRNK